MYIKSFLLLICLFVCASCTTFRYYYPSHEFKERAYNPVKKGRVEMSVQEQMTYSERPGHITSWGVAHDRGLKRAKQSISEFCDGKFMIKTVVEKKENMGVRSDTSYSSNYRTDKDKYNTGAYGKGSQALSGHNMTVAGMRKNILSNAFGGYVDSGNEVETGNENAYSTTRTAPIFRKYTDITFQCKR